MKQTAYGKPLIISNDQNVLHLSKSDAMDELTIQNLIFEYPETLPISDIDESYNPVLPVCKELNTTVGPVDILMISPNGELTLIETKLWRNPEARRKVVAQILDYAKEIASWSYEDLEREVNRRIGRRDNSLYKLVHTKRPNDVPTEAEFVDSVSRNLSKGRFLLLIVGDGIREGVNAIGEYLTNAAHLHFSFAMVELDLLQHEDIGTLVVPKTIIKTKEISKITIDVPDGFKLSYDGGPSKTTVASSDPEKAKERRFYSRFWNELVTELTFDDPGQDIPKPATAQNLFVYPASSTKVWISAYFMKSNKRVGVYLRAQNDQEGHDIIERLTPFIDQIREELGEEIIGSWGATGDIGVRMPCDDIFAEENREAIKDFFKHWLNAFVNALRPRLKKIDK